MGQYYRIKLNGNVYNTSYIDPKGEIHGNGWKLLEFNWLKNPITEIIAKTLTEYTTRLALVGDYADDIFRFPDNLMEAIKGEYPDLKYYYQIKEKATKLGYIGENKHFPQITLTYFQLKNIYEETWKKNSEELDENLLKQEVEEYEEWHDMYFVNHSRREYIDLREYINQSTTKDGWCISPFIITALGNEMGGGDYRGYRGTERKKPPHLDKVGYWAYDLLSIEEEIPQNYKELKVFFKEED